MTLYLFRHGETKQSKNGFEYGAEELTAEILPESIPVVERIAEHLKTVQSDANYTSEYLRCRQTAEIVGRISGKKFVATPLLNEYVNGEFEDFLKRGEEFLKMCTLRNHQSVTVCTHGAMVACLTNLVKKGQFKIEDLLNYPKTGIVWEVSEKNFKEGDFN